MIPNYQQFMRPFLEISHAANGSEVKLRDVINELANKFNLTEEVKVETLPSGKQSILDNRVGWPRTYLKKNRKVYLLLLMTLPLQQAKQLKIWVCV